MLQVIMSNPRKGRCLCGEEATIRDTKADDGRLHFVCHDLTETGRPKHYGFVDASDAESLKKPEELVDPATDPTQSELEARARRRFEPDHEGPARTTKRSRFGFPIN